MTSELFYELYRKLAAVRGESSKGLPILNEFAQVCREREKASLSFDEWLAEADSCLHEIAYSSNLFAMAVSSWLVVNEEVLLAKALINKASVRHLQQRSAEAYDLSNIDEMRAILAGCRLCTLGAAPAISLGWALSLTISHPKSDKISHAVECLLQYHIDELPRTTLRLLSSDDSPFKSVEKAREVIVSLEEQETWLEGLPRLREFAMTPEMRLTMFSVDSQIIWWGFS